MNTILSSARRGAFVFCAGAALMIPGVRAADQAPSLADAFTQPESYIKISGLAPSITGDQEAYAATHAGQPPATGVVGIEDFRYSKDLSDVNSLLINGRVLEGSHDYLGSVDMSNSSYGSLDVGFKRFRTFYDGVGGFFPMADFFMKASPEALYVDRATFWAVAKLAKQDCPVFTLSFRNETRTGMKDSSEWASVINPNATVTAGALVGTALPANTPFIAPNVMQLDEHHDIVEASMVGTFGKTTETLKATVDTVNNDDARSYVKYPGSKVIADPTVVVTDDQELTRTTSFRALSETETKFSEKISVGVGLTYLHVTEAMGGNWLTPTYAATPNAVYVADTAAAIYGSARFDDYIGNLTLKLTPVKDLDIDLAYRSEGNVTASQGGFTGTTLASGAKTIAATNITTSNDLTYSHYSDHVSTPEVSVEYTGISRVTAYGGFSEQVDHGNQHWVNPYADITTTGAGVVTTSGAALRSIFFQEANQDYDEAKLGFNWDACNEATLRVEGFRKCHENKFIGANDIVGTASYGALYVTGYDYDGLKVTLVLKPFKELSFSTRYQPQEGNMSVTGNTATGGNLSDVTSGKMRGQQISETVDYNPTSRFYLQGNVNFAYNYIQTSYPVVVVSATTNIAAPIQNANNNYVSSSALAGFVVSKNTDAQLQGIWTTADNFNPQIAAGGQPYGGSFRNLTLTAGLKHKFNESFSGECKVGYVRYSDNTTGGFTNYHGPLAYASITYSL